MSSADSYASQSDYFYNSVENVCNEEARCTDNKNRYTQLMTLIGGCKVADLTVTEMLFLAESPSGDQQWRQRLFYSDGRNEELLRIFKKLECD